MPSNQTSNPFVILQGRGKPVLPSFFLSFFLLILARSNYDHYARECDFGILKKKNKNKKKQKQNKKKQKNLSAVFLTE